MGAALAISTSAKLRRVSRGAGSGGNGEHTGGGREHRVADVGTAAHRGRHILTQREIEAAIAWRLDGVPNADVQVIADLIRPMASDFREGRPEVAAMLLDLRRPNDRRSGWSMACAILAADAGGRSNWSLFWAAGFEVVSAFRHAKRGSHRNRRRAQPDALDALIAAHLADQPGITWRAMFDTFACIASTFDSMLVEYDEAQDELVCQLDTASESLTNVGRSSFAARFDRARTKVGGAGGFSSAPARATEG